MWKAQGKEQTRHLEDTDGGSICQDPACYTAVEIKPCGTDVRETKIQVTHPTHTDHGFMTGLSVRGKGAGHLSTNTCLDGKRRTQALPHTVHESLLQVAQLQLEKHLEGNILVSGRRSSSV